MFEYSTSRPLAICAAKLRRNLSFDSKNHQTVNQLNAHTQPSTTIPTAPDRSTQSLYNQFEKVRLVKMLPQLARPLFRATAPTMSTLLRTTLCAAQQQARISTQTSSVFSRIAARPSLAIAARPAWEVQTRGMKVRSSVKKLCDGCKVRMSCFSYRDERVEEGENGGRFWE